MYKEIDHTADVAYEIIADNFLEILEDIIEIIKINYKPKNLNCDVRESQEYDVQENEDGIFDIVNDWIAAIELGYFPVGVEKKQKYITYFCSYETIEGDMFKALTYHNLKIDTKGDKLSLKVVFDV